MKKITAILLILLLGTPVFSQQKQMTYSAFCKEYESLLKAQPASDFSMNLSTKLLSDVKTTTAALETKATVEKGTGLFQAVHSNAVIRLQNEQFLLEIDTMEHTILVMPSKKDPASGAAISEQLKKCDSTKYSFYKQIVKGTIKFTVKEIQPQSTNQEVVIEFNEKTKFIEKITILYWPSNYVMNDLNDEALEQPKLELIYSGYQATTTNNTTIQKEISEWIIAEKNTIRTSFALGNTYQLTDLRITESKR